MSCDFDTFDHNRLETLLQEEFPDTFQELKDTYNPSFIPDDGPTVTLYCYDGPEITGYRHHMHSDTWSRSHIGDHEWLIHGSYEPRDACSYDDCSPVFIFYKSETEVKSFMAQSYRDSDCTHFGSIHAPQCTLKRDWRPCDLIYPVPYNAIPSSYGLSTRSIYHSISWIILSFWYRLKRLVTPSEDDYLNRTLLTMFFHAIWTYRPRYGYCERPPFWDAFRFHSDTYHVGDGNLPFHISEYSSQDEAFDAFLSSDPS